MRAAHNGPTLRGPSAGIGYAVLPGSAFGSPVGEAPGYSSLISRPRGASAPLLMLLALTTTLALGAAEYSSCRSRSCWSGLVREQVRPLVIIGCSAPPTWRACPAPCSPPARRSPPSPHRPHLPGPGPPARPRRGIPDRRRRQRRCHRHRSRRTARPARLVPHDRTRVPRAARLGHRPTGRCTRCGSPPTRAPPARTRHGGGPNLRVDGGVVGSKPLRVHRELPRRHDRPGNEFSAPVRPRSRSAGARRVHASAPMGVDAGGTQ